MKLQYIATFKIMVFIVTFFVGTSPFNETQADDDFNDQIRPRIGLKAETVIRNDLKQMGLTVTEITLSGKMANARIPVRGEVANIEIDRRTGTVQIIEASPIAHQFIKSHVPKVQLLIKPKLVVPSDPIRLDPGIKNVPRLRFPPSLDSR